MKREQERTEYLIVGAGPAGLQLGYCLERAKRSYIILEGASPGQFFLRFPRHRTLISINKCYTGYENDELNLRWDWNSLLSDDRRLRFRNYSQDYFPDASSMVKYLEDFARQCRLNIRNRTRVVRISRRAEGFEVTDQAGNRFCSPRVILATGLYKPYIPPIPGIEAAESYSEVSIEPQSFAGQRVLIIGKGNSAFETANNLVGTTSLMHLASPHPVKMAWKTHFVGDLRAVNNNVIDTYMLKSQNALIDATIEKIERINGRLAVTYSYAHADSETEELHYDRVILCAGFRFDDSIFDESCRPALVMDGRLPSQTSEWESVNVPNLYFAGTLMQMRDYKKEQSAFIHGFRYNVKMLHSILEFKHHGLPLARRSVARTPEAVVAAVIERVNLTSALWQQTGFMCDLIIVRHGTAEVDYYEDLTVDYVQDKFGEEEQYYTITLEFGQERIDAAPDIFQIERPRREDTPRANLSTGLHPIVRRYSRGNLLVVHHVIEDFLSEWKEDVHIRPLLEFMSTEFCIGKSLAAQC